MTISDIINSTQLALTVVLILFSWNLLSAWRRTVQGIILSAFGNENLLPGQLLVLGVFVSFAGGLFDNIFWGVHWALAFFEHPAQPGWFSWGPTANVFFRQIPGIVAVMLHLLSAAIDAKTVGNLRKHSLVYFVCGGIIAALMLSAPAMSSRF